MYDIVSELIESAMYLYKATKDPFLLELAMDMVESIEHSCKTECGYATVIITETKHLRLKCLCTQSAAALCFR